MGDLVKEVNSLNGDYLISCHLNAYDNKTQETEVLCSYSSKKGKELATVEVDIKLSNIDIYDIFNELMLRKKEQKNYLSKSALIAILGILNLEINETKNGIIVNLQDKYDFIQEC